MADDDNLLERAHALARAFLHTLPDRPTNAGARFSTLVRALGGDVPAGPAPSGDVIEALVREGIASEDGFILVTSRASYEMVEKVAAWGGAILVAISAPTSLAIDRARHHGMTLACLARDDTMTLFAGADRLLAPVPA